ncbi:integrator complex subunit 1 [Aricia agestis]|uniref:integrator complex subunit 1 n=1 Tax=Aricia agestis TaxID=91739 RepID=UPI001C2044F5|nr:integrator complex subunit 1 [Aricia agestis]
MERGKMSSSGRGGKSKAPQHPQDIFALGSKSTVVVSRDSEKRNIHKPSTSGVGERKRETSSFGTQPPSKRARIGSPAEAISGTSLEIDPVDLVPNVLQALDTHNSDKLLGLLTGSIRLLKSQRSKPDPILCMSLLYLTKIRPNMFAHETVTQTLCTLLKREQGTAFKSKGNPLVFVLACNMLYAGHKDSNSWPDIFIKVYIEDALNERWWVECLWCKCLVENIVTAFGTKHPPPHLIPTESSIGTMSPSGAGSPLMGNVEEETDNTELEYSVFPRYSSSYESVETLVLEAIKEQIQRRAAPDAIGKGFLKLLSATCGFPEIRMIAASRLEAWLHSGKLWRAAQELLAHVCTNARASGPSAARDHEVLAQLARMRLKTKPLQAAYQACLRDMVADSPALLRGVVTHTVYNELSAARAPHNMAVLAALVAAQPQLAPAALADTYAELALRADDYLRPLRALTRELVRAARADSALLPLARALAAPPPHDPPPELRERAFHALTDLFCLCCLLAAQHGRQRAQLCALQQHALAWLLDTAVPVYRPARADLLAALHKIMFVEPPEAYSKLDNWPPESERALTYRLCCEAPLPQNTLLRLVFIGLSKEIPVSSTEVFELVEQLVRRACALPPDDAPLQVDKLEVAEYVFQLCQFHPPDNITLPAGYAPPPLAITSLYWRGWMLLVMIAAHNPQGFAERAANAYPTLRALIEFCITGKPSIEWGSAATEAERAETERAAILGLETHLAAAGGAKTPVSEHASRLLAQLTALEPAGPPRRPPAAALDALAALSQQLRLARLLCRQPALLLRLVERHGTRRALPWLHQLLRHERLELHALPVQCLCELLGAGADGKAPELAAHLRRTLQQPDGARAVLHYYMQRLAHHHAPTRAAANRGLKLVLSPSDDSTEMDYNADVSPEEWLSLVEGLQHWDALKAEALRRVRAACLVECAPAHVAAYLVFLAKHADRPATDLVLDLSQVIMERTTVMGYVLPAAEGERSAAQHRALHALTGIFYRHLRGLLEGTAEPEPPEEEGEPSAWSGGARLLLQWATGRRAELHALVAHAHLKLLCYGPSALDTNQEMYAWLQSTWVEAASGAADAGSAAEEELLPDWLRLHLVRSARPPLLQVGLRGLPAHKLALFIQTFGMPVPSMSALLAALDACPAGAVVRLGVERGYMAQLLRVQRARGATGGNAFAAALRLTRPTHPPDEALFAEQSLPAEEEDAWAEPLTVTPLRAEDVPALLRAAFDASTPRPDLLDGFTHLHHMLCTEARSGGGVYVRTALQYVRSLPHPAPLLRQPAIAAPLLRALALAAPTEVIEIYSALVVQCKLLRGPVVEALRAGAATHDPAAAAPPLPPLTTKEQIVKVFESCTASTLEAVGTRVIERADTRLVVDAITELLTNNQDGRYDLPIKMEAELVSGAREHALSSRGRGCGLLLDWLAELQRETLGRQEAQVRLMFVAGGGAWRPLLVTLLAHRASWRTLDACLRTLLQPNGGWSAPAVLRFAETLVGSPRVWQGRDRATPKHQQPDDLLRLTHQQLEVLVQYISSEATAAERAGGAEAARRRVEARLPLLLRCCPAPDALLTAALAAHHAHPLLLLLLYLKVPRVLQLLRESGSRAGDTARGALEAAAAAGGGSVGATAARSTSATDRVSHALLTALAAPAPHSKENSQKAVRLEAATRALWARQWGAGARALPLAGALLRGLRQRHAQLLAAVEVLPDVDLFSPHASEEVHKILESFLELVGQQAGGGGGGGGGGQLAHRVGALLRRYRAARPPRAAALLAAYRDIIASSPALSAATGGGGGESASTAPPPHALQALRRRTAPPMELLWHIQEVEAWGVRRGGAWGGAAAAAALLRATAPLAAHSYPPLRSAALSLLVKLLPAVPDTYPALRAIGECLESSEGGVCGGALERLAELAAALPEHAALLLLRVFELAASDRLPADQPLARALTTLNHHRGC